MAAETLGRRLLVSLGQKAEGQGRCQCFGRGGDDNTSKEGNKEESDGSIKDESTGN